MWARSNERLFLCAIVGRDERPTARSCSAVEGPTFRILVPEGAGAGLRIKVGNTLEVKVFLAGQNTSHRKKRKHAAAMRSGSSM